MNTFLKFLLPLMVSFQPILNVDCLPFINEEFNITCGSKAHISTSLELSQLGNAANIILTLGSCPPGINVIANTASILFGAYKLQDVLRTTQCIIDNVRLSTYDSEKIKQCERPMINIRNLATGFQGIIVSGDALSYIPFVGCVLMVQKLGILYGQLVVYQKNLGEWEHNKCAEIMPPSCRC